MDSSLFKARILEGKVTVITGGGSGIGLEISTQFGLHGAAVAIMDRRKLVLDSAIAVLQELGIRTGKRIGLGRDRASGVYVLQQDDIRRGLVTSVSNLESSHIWHCRLGQPSHQHLQQAHT